MNKLRLASWNLRYDVNPDNIPLEHSLSTIPDPLLQPTTQLVGEQPWSARRVAIARTLFAAQPDLVGFQEALIRQVHDVAELLGDDYAWVGVGRDDNPSSGEFSPIFYRLSALTFLTTDTFWLSHVPFTPGSWYPGAGCPRIATVAHFRELILLNTHLDHVSDAQRRLGAAMLLHRARYEAHANPGVPIFVTGDFNSSAKGDDEGAYAVITGAQQAPPVPDEFAQRFPLPQRAEGAEELVMVDLRVAVPRLNVGGIWATFTGFERRKKDEVCIDFVFGRSGGGWEAKNVFVCGNLTDDGMLSSDHRLVVADVVFP
ncbi:Endonuclease/exonuclease/phosphatase [Lactarius quietus]|nr:Endonuclease/exonuclease/phosphatase [Lactarius quietus]